MITCILAWLLQWNNFVIFPSLIIEAVIVILLTETIFNRK